MSDWDDGYMAGRNTCKVKRERVTEVVEAWAELTEADEQAADEIAYRWPDLHDALEKLADWGANR